MLEPGRDYENEAVSLGLFDAQWYQATYPDVPKVGIPPFEHFLRLGTLLRRDPSENFSTAYYLEQRPELIETGANPLIDYLERGREEGRLPHPEVGQVALVVHAFHLDVVGEIVSYVGNFPEDADRFVTYPELLSADAVRFLEKSFPGAVLMPVPNAGQDLGALIALARQHDLTRYAAICKIHTKKGMKEPERWRHALLRGTLGGRSQVAQTIRAFRRDPNLMLSGPRQLYLHGPTYIWKNAATLRETFGNVLGDFDVEQEDWGFIGGTCFWMSSRVLELVLEATQEIEFSASAYTDDGTIAHALERLFGLMPTLLGGKVRLVDVEAPDKSATFGPGFPESGLREMRMLSDLLRDLDLPEKLFEPKPVRGGLELRPNRRSINGWLARPGDPAPRVGLLRSEDIEIEVEAIGFRSDIRDHGVNQGWHAFSVSVPGKLMDGKPHEVALLDKETGQEVFRRSCSWTPPKRDYATFQEFLKHSMTDPVIEAPFMEEDKRAFAVMEGIAERLSRRALALQVPPLVSVVMPMYDRADLVEAAIASVLAQSYGNFELIVVDDGSEDGSAEVVRAISDSRIKLIELDRNRGVTVARNTALKEAQGEIIAYLDTDNAWDPRYIAATVGAFEELPDADAIYSGVMLFRGGSSEPLAVRYGHFNKALLENHNYVDNNVFAHRKAFLEHLGGFDESLRRFVDYDLVLRATDLGRVYSVPVLLCHYHFDRAPNAITANASFVGDLQQVRSRQLERRQHELEAADRAELTRPVAVVIPNWQSLDDIRDCLGALQAHDWQGQLEVIVVDNDSAPPVIDYLQEEADAGRIRFLPLGHNYGFTHAVNAGIAQARPDTDIVLLNNDAIAQPGALQALQRACLENPRAGITAPRQILPPGTKTLRTHVPFAREGYECDVNISAHHRNVAEVPLYHDGGALELTYAAFFAVYIRREVIEAIGPLDAEFGRHYRSDRVYCDMMRNLTDYRMFYTPESHFIHKLQKATDHLRDIGDRDASFDMMFRRNQWDAETADELGYRRAAWDIF